MKKYLLYTIIATVGLSASGCRNWMDINTSPNDATEAIMTEALILPAQQYDILNNHVNSTNAWMLSHHITKSGEVSGNYTFLNGQIMPQDMNSWWSTYYNINWQLKWIYNKANQNEDKVYMGIAELLQIINFQRVVDIWGSAPYTQACDPLNYTAPVYDKDTDIYADLIKRTDNVIANLESSVGHYSTVELGKVDIMCHGDIEQWVRMAYSVKLRLLMRVSMVQDVSSQVAGIVGKCLAIGESVEANPGYLPESGKMNILYENYGWDRNGGTNSNYRYFGVTSELVDMLKKYNDPRLRVYANPRKELGNADDQFSDYSKFGLENDYYIGIPYGQQNPSGEEFNCKVGTGLLVGGSDHSVGRLRSSTFMTGAESGFLLAEAALRGLIPGGDATAKQYYEASVAAAMKRHEQALQDTKYGVVGMIPAIEGSAQDATDAYLGQDDPAVNWNKMTTNDQKLAAICTQKWLAFVGYNPLESWFEQRRTDLPVLKASNWSEMNRNISRLPYPQSELNYNKENVGAQPEIDVFNSLVFWDKENPVVERTELYL